ncbi:uncharacterized protein [Dasypus novemcinctus]|uniref:uncharacterized protein n=1 Tax=Dasypus novemcinctus TaxID=9361 RepID=UPI00265F8562|nr:uncharacterized protein LOC101427649 [Dasypus novemcinctus]
MGPGQDATPEEPVVWISDDDTDTEAGAGGSVQVVEPSADPDPEVKRAEEVVDEESGLVVTFCRKGNVMPHARYDCPTHPFERTENETSFPVSQNSDMCSQCYCYICDELASEKQPQTGLTTENTRTCRFWAAPALCHCNAHNKSRYWKGQRSQVLTGILLTFNLEPAEVDADLRHGGERLLQFVQELAVAYTSYVRGEIPAVQTCACRSRAHLRRCRFCHCPHSEPVHRYSAVFSLVSSFISQAEREPAKASAVMLLGAARELALHKDQSRAWQKVGTTESVKLAVPLLMARIARLLQRALVLGDFPKPLSEKFIRFFQSIPLPPHCFGFANCLNVAPWDHRLLTTVLRGQNVTGQLKRSGKKELLWEAFAVVRARVERLESTGLYKEAVRYLKAVRCEDTTGLRGLQDKIPFYLCKGGDFAGAVQALVLPVGSLACCAACRLSPPHFESYLKMLWTGSVPTGNHLCGADQWTVGVGAPVKPCVLVQRALQVLYSSQALYRNVHCWGALLTTWGCSPVLEPSGRLTTLALEAPPPAFQEMVLRVSDGILQELRVRTNASLPPDLFSGPLGPAACLLLCVQAALQMLLTELPWLTSLLEILLAFGRNFWALKLFLEGLLYQTPVLQDAVRVIVQDLSYQKGSLLKMWQVLGPDYVGELLHLFLSFRNPEIQTIGIFLSRIVVDNLSLCPWAKSLDLDRLKTLKGPHLEAAHHLQLSEFVSVLESL